MQIKFNVVGSERKQLVNAIAEIVEAESKYRGAPSFAYEVDYFTIDRNGTLIFDDRADSEEIENLLDNLVSRGFTFEEAHNATQSEQHANSGLVIELPIDSFTEIAFANLERLIASKGELIKKALGIENLPIEKVEDKVYFPWFPFESTADEVKAYVHFISSICKMSKSQTRITTSKKEVFNEKYAFRCFLLRLGFIGSEYKTERKILLSKLTGSSAFKAPKSEVSVNE